MREREEIENSCKRGDGYLEDNLDWQILRFF
jgi:hypothetical protein